MPASSHRLETFGGLALATGGSRSLSHQRLRLAALALLAASGSRGVSRDRIAAYLWPDSEAAPARHALEQLIHALRRSLGDSIFTGVNPIALNSDALPSDLAEFESALQRSDYVTAVSVYRGPFLEGFFLENAGEFERWVEAERSRLAGKFLKALIALAEHDEQNRDLRAAAEWRKRIAATDPLNGRLALQYMRALVTAGDRAAALQHARVHEQLVRQELETDADPSVVEYATSLREMSDAERPRVQTDVSRPAHEPTTSVGTVGVDKTAKGDDASPRSRQWHVPWSTRHAIVAAALAAVTLLSWPIVQRATRPALDQHAIVILPFRITSNDSSENYLREGVVDLLSPLLTGEGGLRAADARSAISAWKERTRGSDGTADDARRVARDFGAGQALLGGIVVTPAGLTLSASLIDADGGERQPIRLSAPVDSIQPLLDAVARQLLGRRSGIPDQTLATLTTASLPALREYLDGRAAYRRAHDEEAIHHFSRALEIDSSFADAGLDLAIATLKILRQGSTCVPGGECRFGTRGIGARVTAIADESPFETGIRLAWQAKERLRPPERLLLEALRGRNGVTSNAVETLADFQKAANAAPERAEAQYLLGIVWLSQGAALDYPDWLQRSEALFANAWSLDPGYLAPLARLVEVAGYERDRVKLRRYGSLYLSRDSTGATADFVRWRVAAGTNDQPVLRSIRARFDSLDMSTLKQIMDASQTSVLELDDADRVSTARLARAVDPAERAFALYDAHMLALNRGRPRLADSLLNERRRAGSSDVSFWMSATLAEVFGRGTKLSPAVEAARDAYLVANAEFVPPKTRVAGGEEVPRTAASRAMWAYSRGDTASAAAGLAWLKARAYASLADNIEMLLATDERRADASAMRARVDTLARTGCCGRGPIYVNLTLARAYERAGDDTSALRALHREHSSWFRAANLKWQGEIAYRLKRYAEAREALEQFLAFRTDPEPELRAERDSVQRILIELRRR